MTNQHSFLRLRLLYLIGLSALILTACSPTGVYLPSEVIVEDVNEVPSTQQFPAHPTLDRWRMALESERYTEARAIAELTDPQQLPEDTLAYYYTLDARMWLAIGDYPAALNTLDSPLLRQHIDLMPLADQIALGMLRADTLYAMQKYGASAQERIFLHPLLSSGTEAMDNRRHIWKSLVQIPSKDIEPLMQKSLSADYRAWLELALIYNQNNGDVSQQLNDITAWQQRWPGHAGANNLSETLDLLKEVQSERPRHIALLLPLTGKFATAGRAVQDGFMASYYNSLNQGWLVPRISSYDTESDDIEFVYEQAVQNGADIIIGPLRKEHVSALMAMPNTVPIIALNYLNNHMPGINGFYQFGLAFEDEAAQIARIARIENHKNALVIRVNGDWAARASQAFADQWQQLDGVVLREAVLNSPEEYSAQISQEMLIPQSISRHKRLQNLTGLHLEFTPRRRNDIDMILVLANDKQAKTIKPLLGYHYARKLPVYSTSNIFDGKKYSKANGDINNVIFNEIPWQFNETSLKKNAQKAYQKNKTLGRLFAMGADAYQIGQRLRQLQQIENASIDGQTGKLTLNEQNRIVRELSIATITKGRVQRMDAYETAF